MERTHRPVPGFSHLHILDNEEARVSYEITVAVNILQYNDIPGASSMTTGDIFVVSE